MVTSVAIHHHHLFSEQGSPFPHHFSDTHSSCYIVDGDVWQPDDEQQHHSSSFLIYFTIHPVHSLYLN